MSRPADALSAVCFGGKDRCSEGEEAPASSTLKNHGNIEQSKRANPLNVFLSHFKKVSRISHSKPRWCPASQLRPAVSGSLTHCIHLAPPNNSKKQPLILVYIILVQFK